MVLHGIGQKSSIIQNETASKKYTRIVLRENRYGVLKSLAKTENMIKQYERLINKNNQSNSIEIANLFYELSC